MREAKFKPGQRVKLLAVNGEPEELGTTSAYVGNGVYIVQVDECYIRGDADTGHREEFEENIESL